VGAHGAVASRAGGDDVTKAVLADYRTAPIDEKLRAALALLEKVTRTPGEVTPADARAVLDAGAGAQGVKDALFVGAMFNMINRLSDAFGFAIPDEKGFAAGAKALLRFGYKV
jgi:alkylhydroperoxidase family enzyme